MNYQESTSRIEYFYEIVVEKEYDVDLEIRERSSVFTDPCGDRRGYEEQDHHVQEQEHVQIFTSCFPGIGDIVRGVHNKRFVIVEGHGLLE